VATKTILIVDDQQLTIQLLEEVFADVGYRTLVARDGADALAILATTCPDLILTDLRMPVLDGFGLCRAVLANLATQTVPLVLMSSVVEMNDAIDFPFAGFVLKPLVIEALLGLIAALIGSPDLGVPLA